MADQLYKQYLTKEFYKAQAAYFDACNSEFLAWQSYSTLQEKTESYFTDDDEFHAIEVTIEMQLRLDQAKEKFKQAKLVTEEAKKNYQQCGAIV